MVNIFDQFDEQESSIVPNIFDQFDEDREEPTEVETPIKSNALPEAGTYSQDDMVDDDQMYTIIENYMVDRYGAHKVLKQQTGCVCW